MARWRPLTWHYLTYFDGCGFGKYRVISLRLALLVPLKPSHNLLVRGSNPCGGTSNSEQWAVSSKPRTAAAFLRNRLSSRRERHGGFVTLHTLISNTKVLYFLPLYSRSSVVDFTEPVSVIDLTRPTPGAYQ